MICGKVLVYLLLRGKKQQLESKKPGPLGAGLCLSFYSYYNAQG